MSGKKQGTQETPQQRALVELARNQLTDYRQRWLPLQKNLAQSISEMGAPDSRERRQALGLTAVENTARFAGAQQKLQTALGQRGELGTSKGKLALVGLGGDQATSAGLGVTRADQQIEDAYITGLSSIMKLGRGQKAEAMGGMADLATISGRRAAEDADAALANRMGNAQLVGKAAGIGLSYATKPGAGDGLQAKFSQTSLGSSGFGSGLAYGNHDLGGFI